MTQLQWTIAIVFGSILALAGAAWRLYVEGFTWRVGASAAMVALLLGGYFRSRRKAPEST